MVPPPNSFKVQFKSNILLSMSVLNTVIFPGQNFRICLLQRTIQSFSSGQNITICFLQRAIETILQVKIAWFVCCRGQHKQCLQVGPVFRTLVRIQSFWANQSGLGLVLQILTLLSSFSRRSKQSQIAAAD